MSDYSKNWDKLENNKNYLEFADIVLQDRKSLLNILNSFFLKFIVDGKKKKVLDLGTGDGILIKSLYNVNQNVDIVAIDGSQDMLKKAEKNLNYIKNIKFICITFEEIIARQLKEKNYDFIVSSFAIHHLLLEQKKELFKSIFDLLNHSGYFINIDTVTCSNKNYYKWYLDLWKEWIVRFQLENKTGTEYQDIPYKAPEKPENHYDPLFKQIQFLNEIGFSEVDCHYKYGLYAIFGGKKL